MNNLNASYERILEVLKKVSSDTLLSYQRRVPQLKDLELISLALTMGIDIENHLFRNLPASIKTKIERSVYNRRKGRLAFAINEIRLKLAQRFNEFENCLIVDSMPLEICKVARSSRSKICKEQNYCYPNRGFCA